jgi:hypothetical protein
MSSTDFAERIVAIPQGRISEGFSIGAIRIVTESATRYSYASGDAGLIARLPPGQRYNSGVDSRAEHDSNEAHPIIIGT